MVHQQRRTLSPPVASFLGCLCAAVLVTASKESADASLRYKMVRVVVAKNKTTAEYFLYHFQNPREPLGTRLRKKGFGRLRGLCFSTTFSGRTWYAVRRLSRPRWCVYRDGKTLGYLPTCQRFQDLKPTRDRQFILYDFVYAERIKDYHPPMENPGVLALKRAGRVIRRD